MNNAIVELLCSSLTICVMHGDCATPGCCQEAMLKALTVYTLALPPNFAMSGFE